MSIHRETSRSDLDVRLPLSLCVIACNEERRISRCLNSAFFVDERIVVVDKRSQDATEALARDAGANVVLNTYEGNIEQKLFAFSLAKHDWVLSLDADEVISPELSRAIINLFHRQLPLFPGYELNRLTWHLGRWIRHGDFHPDWQLRLFRRSHAHLEGTNPHGRVHIRGTVRRLPGDLHHFSYRDLSDQIERIQDFSSTQAKALARKGHRAGFSSLVLRPPWRFLRAYLLRGGFRDGVPGFIVAVATAFHVFLKYAKLWEEQSLRVSDLGLADDIGPTEDDDGEGWSSFDGWSEGPATGLSAASPRGGGNRATGPVAGR